MLYIFYKWNFPGRALWGGGEPKAENYLAQDEENVLLDQGNGMVLLSSFFYRIYDLFARKAFMFFIFPQSDKKVVAYIARFSGRGSFFRAEGGRKEEREEGEEEWETDDPLFYQMKRNPAEKACTLSTASL